MYLMLGKNGYIAEAITKELQSRNLTHITLSRKDVDYTNKSQLDLFLLNNLNRNLLEGEKIIIINCAGYIGKPNVDACELAKADCIEGNVLLPAMLSQLCEDRCYQYVHISSGCIYGGYEKDFTEEDEPNFNFQNGSFYSGTKALAEKVVSQNNPDSYIFRLRIPFDEHASPRNYLTKLLSYDTLLDAKNSLSHRADFAKYAIDLIEKQVPYGIYNITNKGSLTTKDVVELIKKHNLSDKQFKFFSNLDTFMQQTIAPRSNCVLDTTKIEKYVKIRSTEDALRDSLSKYTIQ